ncbi:FCD domain-containing protein [Actinoplanes sp. TRM 88003]|uniref:FCD domain-containing protein n=1 Tax=Paractinoplanes aksuensis TaxID=2939490 RepID=A0ABT1DH66_9ACTN|nr:FCD domain-containing protein [Actinoplanes aksuensis]MCO8270142.1 FCD domain-containing protein [Actinoplanes aksuensis]
MQQFTARGVHGQTVEVLAQRILDGRMPEGSTLDLTALQTEFDVSLTVLREALRVLAAKGMVDARPKRGTFVRPRANWSLLDADVLRWQFARSPHRPGLFDDLHELRGIVEPGAASLAAARATDEDIEALDAALADMAAAGDDPAAAVAADLAFHRALLAATHNELIQRMEVVIETGLAERDRMVHGTAGADDPVPSHKAVVDAIRRHHPAQAARAMGKLLDQAVEDVARLERTQREPREDRQD